MPFRAGERPVGGDATPSGALTALHARARAGDGRATAQLVELLYPRVRACVSRRLGRYAPDVVADAVQEAMVCVLAYLPSSRATCDRQLVRWAGLVGWHAALRYLRSPAAGLPTGWDGVLLEVTPHAALDASAGGSADAEECDAARVVGEALAEALASAWAALSAVSAVNAAIVWHRVVQDRPYAELAAAAGTTPAGAKRRFQRSVAYLRRATLAALGRLPAPIRGAALDHLRVAGDG